MRISELLRHVERFAPLAAWKKVTVYSKKRSMTSLYVSLTIKILRSDRKSRRAIKQMDKVILRIIIYDKMKTYLDSYIFSTVSLVIHVGCVCL